MIHAGMQHVHRVQGLPYIVTQLFLGTAMGFGLVGVAVAPGGA